MNVQLFYHDTGTYPNSNDMFDTMRRFTSVGTASIR